MSHSPAPVELGVPPFVARRARVRLTLLTGAALHRVCREELNRSGLFVPLALAGPRGARVDVDLVCADGARFALPCAVLHVFAGTGTALELTAEAAGALDALFAHALFVPPEGDPRAVDVGLEGGALALLLDEIDDDDDDVAAVLEDADALDDDAAEAAANDERRDSQDDGTDFGASDGGADRGAGSLFHEVGGMTLAEKRHAALHGGREARLLLARDRNPALHVLVVKNAALTLDDADALARMPGLSPDALHLLARDWSKTPSLVRSLVKNPKTPLADAIALVPRLAVADLRALAKSGGVRGPVLTAVRRLVNG